MIPRYPKAASAAALIAVCTCLMLTGAASGQEKDLPVTPTSLWIVSASPGDTVELSQASGVLKARYSVTVNTTRQVGHQTLRDASFTLLLAEPVTLTPEQVRVYFEARSDAPAKTIAIRPLIQDENGELLSYEPLPVKPFIGKDAAGGWKAYRTHSFLTTEAGGATQNVYDAEGGDHNAWPDGRLTFKGFLVRVGLDPAAPQQTARSGEIELAGLALGGLPVREQPFAYAESLLREKGEHRIAFEVKAAYQGQPIREVAQAIDFDPADPAKRREKISLPLEKLHNSWVNYQITGPDGKVVVRDSFRWEQNLPDDPDVRLPATDLAKAPAVGLVRINPDRARSPRETGGIYADGQPMTVTVRVFPPKGQSAGERSLRWALSPYGFTTPIEEGTVAVNTKDKPYVDIPLKLKSPADRTAFTLRYTITGENNTTLDEGQYTLGIKRETAAYTSRTANLPDRNEIKKYPYFRTTFVSNQEKKSRTEESIVESFRKMLSESRQMADHVTYMIDLADFEILPGVYDFSMLDRIMDTASDHGFGVTVRLAHVEGAAPYQWMPYTLPRSFDGTALTGHPYYGSFSVTDEGFVDSWLRAFRAIHDRYAKHPGFEGYYVMQPGGEWTLADEPWNGYICGYSITEALAFRKYLRDELKLSLEDLNKRWGTSYTAWSEVMPPQPDLSAGSRPDLRPQWIDFSRCKLTWRNSWYVKVARHIREYDPTHIIIAYDGWTAPLKEMTGLVDYLHNGGNHFLEGEGWLVDSWKNGRMGWITEPHHPHRWAAYGDPSEGGWVLDWSVFVMTAQAGAGGENLHVYYMPNPTDSLAAHYGGAFAYDRFELFKPILRELHGSELIEVPKQIAVVQDLDTLLTKHRTTFDARLADLRRWFDLLKMDSLDFEDYRPERESSYKLVVLNPLDQVVSEASINAITRMVQNGAWLVMNARSAEYCPDLPDAKFPLLAKFGIAAPEAGFDTATENVVSKVEPNQSLIPGKKEIPFFSQADMSRQIKDPSIGAKFWKWPYRWIPQADYFGRYPGHKASDGETIARFADGGSAISLHTAGKGRVVVLWGTPDSGVPELTGLMGDIARAAGVTNPREGNPIPLMLEAQRPDLKRHYCLLFSETKGSMVQKIPNVPDGDYFIDDMVTGQRLGTFSGASLRTEGMPLTYAEGYSPLKILRMIPSKSIDAKWLDKYPKQH